MRTHSIVLLAMAGAVLPAASALADFDVSPYVSGGKILTGGYEDASNTFMSNVRVLDFGFDDFDGTLYTTEDPGFHPQASSSGFTPADSIVVSAVSGLSYYGGDGSGPISFTTVAGGGPTLTYTYGTSGSLVIASKAPSGSINLGHPDANGEADRHLNASLAGASGQAAVDGLYLVQLQVSDPGSAYAASAPAFILYSVNDDDAVDPAKEYLRNQFAPGTNLTPEPSSLGLLGIGGLALFRRKRQ